MVLFSWMSLVGIVRAEFLRCRNFWLCTRGTSDGRRWQTHYASSHMLPNAMVASLTMMPFILSGSVTTRAASLGGISWALVFLRGRPLVGELLAQVKLTQAPWLGISTRSLYFLWCLRYSRTTVGEAVRDAFDPHQQRQRLSFWLQIQLLLLSSNHEWSCLWALEEKKADRAGNTRCFAEGNIQRETLALRWESGSWVNRWRLTRS